jgi:hypothetical protein
VIQLVGYHFHNKNMSDQGAQYVREALIKKLDAGTVLLPVGAGGKMEMVTLKDLGLSNPVLVEGSKLRDVNIPDPEVDLAEVAAGKAAPKSIPLRQFDFIVQMSWQETPLSKRIQKKQELEKAKLAGGAAPAAVPGNP